MCEEQLYIIHVFSSLHPRYSRRRFPARWRTASRCLACRWSRTPRKGPSLSAPSTCATVNHRPARQHTKPIRHRHAHTDTFKGHDWGRFRRPHLNSIKSPAFVRVLQMAGFGPTCVTFNSPGLSFDGGDAVDLSAAAACLLRFASTALRSALCKTRGSRLKV